MHFIGQKRCKHLCGHIGTVKLRHTDLAQHIYKILKLDCEMSESLTVLYYLSKWGFLVYIRGRWHEYSYILFLFTYSEVYPP